MNGLRLSCKLFQRDWRSGELRIMLIALIIAVACVTSIGFFNDRISRAVNQEASELLGGDLVLTSTQEIPSAWLAKARQSQLKIAETLLFFSVVSHGEQLQLASIKAVSANYPLKGNVTITDKAFTPGMTTETIPKPGTLWIQSRLAPLLKTKIGNSLDLGEASFKLTKFLVNEPDQSGGWFNISPRVLMNIKDVPKTEVVRPGSRVEYRTLFAGPPQLIKQFSQWLKPKLSPSQKLLTPDENAPTLSTTLKRLTQFLHLTAMLSVILAGIAITMGAGRYCRRHYDTVALMRCFGLPQKRILRIYSVIFLILGVIGAVIGALIGFVSQFALAKLLTGLLPITLPKTHGFPALFGILIGLLILFGFSLPLLMDLKKISPLKVLRRELVPITRSSRWVYVSALMAIFLLLWWYTQALALTSLLLAGIMVSAVVLWLGSFSLVYLTTRLRRHGSRGAWRYGLANIARHAKASIIQVLAFGLTLTVILLLTLVRADLINTWKAQLPKQAPNYFVINIAPKQVAGLRKFLQQEAVKSDRLYPMIRGRIVTLNDKPIRQAVPEGAKNHNALNRELNLSWAETMPAENKLIKGQWWQANDKKNVISVAQRLAEQLGLKIGDEVGFRIGAETIKAKIINLRNVEWMSFRPNFFVIFPPHILNTFPMTYITSFYLPPGQTQVLNRLIKKFPNITLIDIATIMQRVETILNQASHALEYLLIFMWLAGVVILFAAINSNLDERRHDNALLRVFGASRQQLRNSVWAEFLILGLLAGLLASILANVIEFILATRLFGIGFHVNLWLLLIAPIISAVMMTTAGIIGTRKVVRVSPLQLLRV